MLAPSFSNALVLTGPTASGKTRLALDLARRLDAEIISMDSMALYRGMDLGTAKPTPDERSQVRHHLVDVLDPWEAASVAWWLKQAEDCCLDIESRGKQVLMVGGTPLYLKALLCGLFEGPPADAALRAQLEEEARQRGGAVLHQRLAEIDPVTACRLHPNDVRRLVRALEVYELTGRPMSAWQTQWQEARVESEESRAERREESREISAKGQETEVQEHGSGSQAAVLWIDLPRAELYERINRRVVEMFQAGLVEEVRALRQLTKPLSKEASQALGYKEVFAFLDGNATLEETIERVQTRSRNFAKRQITWFRHLPMCRPATSELTYTLWQPKMKCT